MDAILLYISGSFLILYSVLEVNIFHIPIILTCFLFVNQIEQFHVFHIPYFLNNFFIVKVFLFSSLYFTTDVSLHKSAFSFENRYNFQKCVY